MTQQLSRNGIGASEISAVVGMNPYASPWDVWLAKTGQAPEPEYTEPMEWGHRLEPAIRQKYVDENGVNVWVPPSSLFHPTVPWARATPDGIVTDDGWRHLLQCKNVGTWVAKAWEDAPPDYVQLQTQWELYVTGLARADVAVLIGGNEFRVYTVHRDDAMIADLVTIATEFWRRVETRTPPKVDASDACANHLRSKLNKASTLELPADSRMEALVTEWRELHVRAKQDERRIKEIKNTLLADLVDAQAARIRTESGVIALRNTGGGKDPTDWRLVAQLLGSKLPDEYAALVAANTNEPTERSKTLYPPATWAKDAK